MVLYGGPTTSSTPSFQAETVSERWTTRSPLVPVSPSVGILQSLRTTRRPPRSHGVPDRQYFGQSPSKVTPGPRGPDRPIRLQFVSTDAELVVAAAEPFRCRSLCCRRCTVLGDITCSTVVLQYYRRQAIPMEQAKIWTSVTLCSMDRSLSNLVWLITSATPTHVQILVKFGWVGNSPQIREI